MYSNSTDHELRQRLSNEEIPNSQYLENLCEQVIYGDEFRRNVPVRAGTRKGKDPASNQGFAPPCPVKFDPRREYKDKREFKREFKRERTPPRRFLAYTQLNKPREMILAANVEKKLDAQWPKSQCRRRSGAMSEEYCEFHKQRGHHTNDCDHLKREIEKLKEDGLLRDAPALDEHPSRHQRNERKREERALEPTSRSLPPTLEEV